MFLKSLTLKGFKSFADRTYMVFDPGLTVVVGPNGSGKSNVSDAILWVLGEQSAKMLRGQAMEDVIFSGSSARKPVGLAEVTLVLDNSDHTLPVDFDEVGVTRRMYRSGESEYLINGSPARLMDIQDILHDSGLGKDTHSIISQGKLDSILASRPEERRALIEEAAGISKHRRRKERSARKLASMDANLVRARDVSREITRQLRPLERQVDKAKRYRDMTARLSELSVTLAVDDLRQLQAEWRGLEGTAKEADAAVELARYRLDEKSAELEKLSSMLEQKGLFVGDLGEQRRRCQDALGRIDSDMRLLEEKGRNMVNHLSETRMTLSTLEKQRRDAGSDQERIDGELSDARVTVAELQSRIDELGPAADAARTARTQAEESVSHLAGAVRSKQREADEATLAHAHLKDQIAGAETQQAMFDSRLKQIQETLDIASEALASSQTLTQTLDSKLEQARSAQSTTAEQAQAATVVVRERTEAVAAARDELTSATSRLQALGSVDVALADASPLVVALAARKDMDGLVECRLGDLIEAPAEIEPVIESLLGEDLNALVVPDVDAAATAADAALGETSAKGRATIVARAGAAHEAVAPGSIVESLTIADGARNLVEGLLGGVILVDDAKAALAGHTKHPSLTHVTRDGIVVCPDGRLHVGTAADATKGTLERKRQMRTLEGTLPTLQNALAAAQAAQTQAETDLTAAREAAAAAAGEVSRLAAELAAGKSESGRLNGQVASATAELAQVTKRRDEVCSKADEARPQLDDYATRAKEAAEQVVSLTDQLKEAGEARDAAVSAHASASEAANAAKLELATVNERLLHLESRSTELARRVRALDHRREAAESSTRSLEVLRLRIDPLHSRYDALRECAVAWASRLRDRASLAEADSESLKKTIGDAKQQVVDATAALEEARSAAGEVKVRSGKLEVQVQTAIERITADGTYILEDALRLPAPEDREATQREVDRLRRQIDGLGPVNQVAMDEYTTLKERADYIEDQLADLTAARTSLTKIMSAIDRKMRRQFLMTFDAVNANFQQIFSMLFPGGQAHLEMLDPEHPSETGIEIVAQPRGKRITKMMLMSGGEKSLTALALLFAVYRTRTVPFYVFDEVEAALDDSNLDKLLGAIEQLKETTQLIVISHQRRTMEQADVLYGVSMQADGVSHVVSQRLDHATGKVVDA